MSAFQLGSMSSSSRFWFAVIRAGSSYLSITCSCGPGRSSIRVNHPHDMSEHHRRHRTLPIAGSIAIKRRPLASSWGVHESLAGTRCRACYQEASLQLPGCPPSKRSACEQRCPCHDARAQRLTPHLAQGLLHLALDAPILDEEPVGELAVALLLPAQVILELPRRQRPVASWQGASQPSGYWQSAREVATTTELPIPDSCTHPVLTTFNCLRRHARNGQKGGGRFP